MEWEQACEETDWINLGNWKSKERETGRERERERERERKRERERHERAAILSASNHQTEASDSVVGRSGQHSINM